MTNVNPAGSIYSNMSGSINVNEINTVKGIKSAVMKLKLNKASGGPVVLTDIKKSTIGKYKNIILHHMVTNLETTVRCTSCTTREVMSDSKYCDKCRCQAEKKAGGRCKRPIEGGGRKYCGQHRK